MYKNISQENFKTSLSTFNIDSLNENELEEYLNLSTLYRKLLNEYIKLLGLQKYDELLKNSNLNFIKIDEQEQDFYQYYNNSNLTYYYIRNNIYLNRLTLEEKNFLKNKLNNQDYTMDNETITFINNTFKKVIKEIHNNVNEPFDTNFGPTSSSFFARNDALVIGFRYDEFNDVGMDDETFDINYENQQKYYKSLNKQLENELKNKLQIPVTVIEYDENSIKKNINYDQIISEKGKIR